MPRRTVGGDEFEAFTRWRRILSWQRGELRKLKRKSAKRERKDAKRVIRDDINC